MPMKKETAVARKVSWDDPIELFRQLSSELDRVLEEGTRPSVHRPVLCSRPQVEGPALTPAIDVFERDRRLVTRVDLPGMRTEDIKVEVSARYLTIVGERDGELEGKKDAFYRSERSFGSFCRAVPLPEGVMLEDVHATFSNGVLEVSVPLPVQPKGEVRTVEIKDAVKPREAA